MTLQPDKEYQEKIETYNYRLYRYWHDKYVGPTNDQKKVKALDYLLGRLV